MSITILTKPTTLGPEGGCGPKKGIIGVPLAFLELKRMIQIKGRFN